LKAGNLTIYLDRRRTKNRAKALYTKNKAFDKTYYFDPDEKAINQHLHIDRKVVEELLWDRYLIGWISDKKRNKSPFTYRIRKTERIKNAGSDYKPMWIKC
jgi:hypothetical protein